MSPALGEASKEENQHRSSAEVGEIPDGGLTAWLQCAGSFALLLNSFGLINSFGVFQTYYERDLLHETSSSDIAWIGSIQAFLLISLGIVPGPLYDHGYLRSLILVGSLLIIFGTLMTGLCSKYWHLILAQGIVVGAGSGCLFLPSIAVLPQYFEKRRAFATGVGSSGSAIGGIIFPIIFNRLQPRIGFRYATWLIALIMLVTLVVPLGFMRMRRLPREARRLFDREALKEWPFILWASYLFVSLLGLYLPSFFIQLYGVRFVDVDVAFDLLPVLNAGSFFGRLVPLYIADKAGPLNVEIVLTSIGGILCLSWIAIRDIPGLFVLSALYGFLAGAITTITAVVDAALCPNLDVIGVRMGMLLVPWAFGLLIGEPVGGAILGPSEDWLGLQVFAGIAIMAAAVLAIVVRIVKYGRRVVC